MKMDKEIAHPYHPQHKLKLEYTEIPFRCDGCREAGIGPKYKCQHHQQGCEFELHKICAVVAPTANITHHPFYNKCEFRLYYEPPGGPEMRMCDACRNDVTGFVYHCDRCGFDLHPCCANLPQVLRLVVEEDDDDDDERRHPPPPPPPPPPPHHHHHTSSCLYLCHKLSSSCHHCGKRGLGWSYRSECKTYSIHVSCVKELLVESWQLMYFNLNPNKIDKVNKVRGAFQTRLIKPPLKLQGTTLITNHHGAGVLRGSQSGGGPGSGKVNTGFQMVGAALRVIVSAILGDPTALIAAVVAGIISK